MHGHSNTQYSAWGEHTLRHHSVAHLCSTWVYRVHRCCRVADGLACAHTACAQGARGQYDLPSERVCQHHNHRQWCMWRLHGPTEERLPCFMPPMCQAPERLQWHRGQVVPASLRRSLRCAMWDGPSCTWPADAAACYGHFGHHHQRQHCGHAPTILAALWPGQRRL